MFSVFVKLYGDTSSFSAHKFQGGGNKTLTAHTEEKC